MEILIGFFIFCLVLFIYLHVQFHLKTSNDLEMYEIDQASKEKLEEICDIRQPVLFDFDNQKIMVIMNTSNIAIEIESNRFKEMMKDYTAATNVMSDEKLENISLLKLKPKETLILELTK